MIFKPPLIHGRLIKRYKRFLSDICLDDNSVVIAHCTNTGSMKSCIEEGAEVYLSPALDPKRKTQFTWEMIKINGHWIGINTLIPNALAYEAVVNNSIPLLSGYTYVQREVNVGESRLDLMAQNDKETCYIEVKNVTYKEGQYALFPDAVSTRGKKHLETLIRLKHEGYRAVMLYIIQRIDVNVFAPAKHIDSEYAQTLREAFDAGVEIIPVIAQVSPTGIELTKTIKLEWV